MWGTVRPLLAIAGRVHGRTHAVHGVRIALNRAVGSARGMATKTISVPSMGDSITEGTISDWVKKVGDPVAADEVVVVIETDKVSIDVRSPVQGMLTNIAAQVDEEVSVGQKLFDIEEGEIPDKVSKPAAAVPAKSVAPPTTPAAAAPTIPPPSPASAKPTTSPTKSATVSTPAVSSGSRVERRVPMSRMRVRIAERLKEAQNTAACLTTFNEVDMSGLMAIRKKYKDLFLEAHEVKLGFMSAFVSAAVSALKEQPSVNAYIEGKEIVYHDYCDISVAVATPTGLVVPVIRDCQEMSFADIERTIQTLGQKARKGQLALEDMAGGTFTISNGGVYGSLMGTPILNPPQSAILGMHGIFDRAVVVEEQIVIRPMMYIALTYDHRIIDGREAVTFLKQIKDSIEDPTRLLLKL